MNEYAHIYIFIIINMKKSWQLARHHVLHACLIFLYPLTYI